MTKNQKDIAIFLLRSHHRRWVAEENVVKHLQSTDGRIRRSIDSMITKGLAEEKVVDTARRYELYYRLTSYGRKMAEKWDDEPWLGVNKIAVR